MTAVIVRSPLALDCPVCTARAGQPCRIRKAAGTYADVRHAQVIGAAFPTHALARRLDATTDPAAVEILSAQLDAALGCADDDQRRILVWAGEAA